MWKSKINLNDAIEYSYEECSDTSRWTNQMWYVIEHPDSPTGFAAFYLTIPKSFETKAFLM